MEHEPLMDPADPTPGADVSPEGPGAAAPNAQPDLAALQQERDDLRDRLLRKTAEFDNYRKRLERERRTRSDQVVTDVLLDLLLVVDDFDLALAVETDEAAAPYRKGVELIHGKLHDLLRRHDVRPFDALGLDFDPNLHQAVTHEASPHHREGEVIGELRRGYLVGDRLLRPAMVKVAKA